MVSLSHLGGPSTSYTPKPQNTIPDVSIFTLLVSHKTNSSIFSPHKMSFFVLYCPCDFDFSKDQDKVSISIYPEFSSSQMQTGAYTVGLQYLGLWIETEPHLQLSWFSLLQTADHGTSQPPKPPDPLPIVPLLLFISPNSLLVQLLWRILT